MTDLSWLETAGALLEAQGYEPGCIFEFHVQIHPSLTPGGMVVSNLPPGVPPKTVLDIVRVSLREERTGEIHFGGLSWPLWLCNSHKVTDYA